MQNNNDIFYKYSVSFTTRHIYEGELLARRRLKYATKRNICTVPRLVNMYTNNIRDFLGNYKVLRRKLKHEVPLFINYNHTFPCLQCCVLFSNTQMYFLTTLLVAIAFDIISAGAVPMASVDAGLLKAPVQSVVRKPIKSNGPISNGVREARFQFSIGW